MIPSNTSNRICLSQIRAVSRGLARIQLKRFHRYLTSFLGAKRLSFCDPMSDDRENKARGSLSMNFDSAIVKKLLLISSYAFLNLSNQMNFNLTGIVRDSCLRVGGHNDVIKLSSTPRSKAIIRTTNSQSANPYRLAC